MSPSSDRISHLDHISVPQKLRFFTSGLALSQTDHVWICLHGYGQLAFYFKRKFQILESRVHLIFPEAAHRFYLDGSDGRVGASWMTKEDRLTDILNQRTYLDTLYEQLIGQSKKTVTVLGFSQGAATGSRWVLGSKAKIDNLVLWSGAFPSDLPDLDVRREKKEDLRVFQVIGIEDPYLKNRAQLSKEQADLLKSLSSEQLTFQGGHEISPAQLDVLCDRIQS